MGHTEIVPETVVSSHQPSDVKVAQCIRYIKLLGGAFMIIAALIGVLLWNMVRSVPCQCEAVTQNEFNAEDEKAKLKTFANTETGKILKTHEEMIRSLQLDLNQEKQETYEQFQAYGTKLDTQESAVKLVSETCAANITQLQMDVKNQGETIKTIGTTLKAHGECSPQVQMEQYVGCFKDAGDRAIGGGYVRLFGDTVTLCIERCTVLKTSYAAIQDRTACFCGNKYTKYGNAPDSECNSQCLNNPGKCGGHFRNSVWQIDEAPSEEEAEKYLGCYKDGGDRAMPGGYKRLHEATVDKCIDRCREMGTRFAGAQNETACFCANEYDKHGPVSESECSDPCPGNSSQKCGGPWRNSVWQLD